MNAKQIILKLLRPGEHRMRMYGSWIALCLGMLLLFVSIIAWLDFTETLAGREHNDSMSEFVVIGKVIDEISIGAHKSRNLFSIEEIKALENIAGVQAVGSLSANRYPVSAAIGGNLGFQTELFLESVSDTFLDYKPEDWHWQAGEPQVPIILSNEFLNLYNYGFALSQGMPQLSHSSIQSLPFQITIAGKERYRASIVGFTDRISSVLVPQSFMEAMNAQYGNTSVQAPSRLILKVKDPSDKAFVSYLKTKKYTVNQEQLRWSRIRTAVGAIVSAVGLVAIVVVGMSILAFMLFVELSVQRAATHIRLMLQIGYAPKALRKILYRFFLPWLLSAVIVALILALGLHYGLLQWLQEMELQIHFMVAWPVVLIAVAVFILMIILLFNAIKKMLAQVV